MLHESKEELLREATAKEIYRLGTRAHIAFHEISKAITNETPLSEWKTFVLDTLKSESPKYDSAESKFSLRKFILDKAEGNTIVGAEREVIDTEASKERGRQAVRGVLLPQSVFKPKKTKRTLVAQGAASAGGHLVDQAILDLIEPLDPEFPMTSRVRKVYPTKPFSVPVKETATTAQWVGETIAPIEQNITFNKIEQTPHNLVGWTTFSLELLKSASVDIERLIRSDLNTAISIGVEKAILKATGIGNEPTGLEANSSITRINRASADSVSYDECLEAEQLVLESNAIMQSQNRNQMQSGENNPRNQMMQKFSLAWICSPRMRRIFKKSPSLGTGTSASLWDVGDIGTEAVTIHGLGSKREPKIIDYPAHVSTFTSNNDSWLGNWGDIVLSYFGSPQVIVDPFTLSTRGLVRVTIFQMIDFFLRHNASICRLSA